MIKGLLSYFANLYVQWYPREETDPNIELVYFDIPGIAE